MAWSLRITGARIVQYDGKWPFVRVLGFQEIVSSAFSALACVPPMLFLWRVRSASGELAASAPAPTPLWLARAGVWRAYAVAQVVSGALSTLFHCRDTPVTMRLDYYGANALVIVGIACTLVHVCALHDRRAYKALVVVGFLTLGSYVVRQEFSARFDFAYNIVCMVFAVATLCLVWIAHLVRLWRAYAHTRLLAVYLVLQAFGGLFDVIEFAPLAWLLDAHAVFHMSLVVSNALFWVFLVRDLHTSYAPMSWRGDDASAGGDVQPATSHASTSPFFVSPPLLDSVRGAPGGDTLAIAEPLRTTSSPARRGGEREHGDERPKRSSSRVVVREPWAVQRV